MASWQRTVVATCISLWTVALVATMTSAAVSGQSPSPERLGTERESKRSNPYSGLFKPNGRERAAAAIPPAPPGVDTAPRVVCGMTVVPVDPSLDRGIAVSPSDRSTRFTIRGVEPPICR
jgi:hypothetical protein